MTTINSWEVLTNDGWQHNFYGTTAHQFTYHTNDQQRKREESAEIELGLHSNAITIMSFSISDVKNIFTGNSISFPQVHQSWVTPFSGLPLFFFFLFSLLTFSFSVNEELKEEGEGCCGSCGLHVHLYITFTLCPFHIFSFFPPFFLLTLHESTAPSKWGISRTDKGILQFPSKRLTL